MSVKKKKKAGERKIREADKERKEKKTDES
jgi:hypothetical protein